MASPPDSDDRAQQEEDAHRQNSHTASAREAEAAEQAAKLEEYRKIFLRDAQGNEVVEWFRALFDGASTYASILAAVMFSSMILDLGTQDHPHGSEGEVRIWSAIGAILFVLLVLLCQGSSLLLRFHHKWFEKKYDRKKFWPRLLLSVISLVFQALWLTGTIFFCLVVKAYVPAVGVTALSLTGILAVVCAVFWLVQCFFEMRSQCRKCQWLKENPQCRKTRLSDEERQDGQMATAANRYCCGI